jgi:ketosteroid isomerase-like protein
MLNICKISFEAVREQFSGDHKPPLQRKDTSVKITSYRLGFCALFLIGIACPFLIRFPLGVSADSSFQAFLPGFEQGINEFINGDPRLWKENTSRRDDVTIMGAWGAFEKGWTEVGPRYDWAAARFKKSGAKATFEYISQIVYDEMAYTITIERSEAHIIDQEKPTKMVLRVTHIFRKEQGVWKLVHRHADPITTKTSPSAVIK